ncbi:MULTISPECIES: hypothetical protein, partial [Pseudomonadota]|uniref:hypothetical protein n=1 Tax=Pseudomonadota TaxID=1224 RepID=UPI001ABF3619
PAAPKSPPKITPRARTLTAGRSACISDPVGHGINDMRFSMSLGQILLSLITLGFVRRVNIDYRLHSGNSPVGGT